jgi:ElaB/YqjD/DUF883 family membrane-anchored ribosome-binding protein
MKEFVFKKMMVATQVGRIPLNAY